MYLQCVLCLCLSCRSGDHDWKEVTEDDPDTHRREVKIIDYTHLGSLDYKVKKQLEYKPVHHPLLEQVKDASQCAYDLVGGPSQFHSCCTEHRNAQWALLAARLCSKPVASAQKAQRTAAAGSWAAWAAWAAYGERGAFC